MTLLGATTPGQSGPGSGVNEGVSKAPALLELHHKMQTAFYSYQINFEIYQYIVVVVGWGSYSSAKMQSVYSATSADWAENHLCVNK